MPILTALSMHMVPCGDAHLVTGADIFTFGSFAHLCASFSGECKHIHPAIEEKTVTEWLIFLFLLIFATLALVIVEYRRTNVITDEMSVIVGGSC